jgi:hypothetical protein
MQVIHAKDFSKLVVQRGHHIRNIEESFSVHKNKKCIKKMGKVSKGGGDGGASGEFFFVTHDGRFFIKTINEEEESVFLNMINQFIEHLLENGTSLIGRIVGYFVFKFNILDQRIKVIIIENIFLIDKSLVKRKYDLKGSTYKRKVLKRGDKRISSTNCLLKDEFEDKSTLKDLDFNKIEGKIILSDSDYTEILTLIAKDVNFFKNNGIIDYSLIIAVVKLDNINKLPEHKQKSAKEQISSLMEKKMFFIDSDHEFGYLVGIIDYFQLFTFQKRMEKYVKILMNCKLGLDTSSQPSNKYAERFNNYISSIFVKESEKYNINMESRKVGQSIDHKNDKIILSDS